MTRPVFSDKPLAEPTLNWTLGNKGLCPTLACWFQDFKSLGKTIFWRLELLAMTTKLDKLGHAWPIAQHLIAWTWESTKTRSCHANHTGHISLTFKATVLYNEFENHTFKIIAISPRGQWVNMVTQILVNIGSGNGLLPDGTKPLPEPMFTYCKYGPVMFILRATSPPEIPQPSITKISFNMLK